MFAKLAEGGHFIWKIIIQKTLIKNLKTTQFLSKNINDYIETNINYLSYYPLGDETFKKIFRKWLKHNLKKKKITSTISKKLVKYFKHYASDTIMCVYFFSKNKNLLRKIILAPIIYSNATIIKYITKLKQTTCAINKKHLYQLTELNISNRQLFGVILDCLLRCLQNYSSGNILKQLGVAEKHYKRQTNYWPLVLKIFLKKFLEQFYKKSTTNILIIRGQHKQFLKLLLFLWKLNFLKFFNYLILKFNLSFTVKQHKSVKSIKRKLMKRFLKIENKQTVEFKNFKKYLVV